MHPGTFRPALLLLLPLLACGFAHVNQDLDTRPEMSAGMGATIVYPGQRAPVLGAPSAGSAAGAETASGHAEPDVTMIGGAAREETGSKRVRNSPLGPLTTLLGYPFWIFGKSVSEKADETRSQNAAEAPPVPSADQQERSRLAAENDQLARELARGTGSGSPAPSARVLERNSNSESPAPAIRPHSIGAELAALRSALTPAPNARKQTPLEPTASRAVDRDRDGHPDYWIYGAAGTPEREVFDDDQNGSPNRIVYYARDGKISRVEEDADGDGRLESVTLFEEGQPVRKRADTGQDGETDAWSFFREGELVRHEVDRNGDGFRDLILWYEAGQLVREEEDRNDDGRADTARFYRDGKLVQRAEDLDFDGNYDVQSFYRDGKLLRKEVSGDLPPPDETLAPLPRNPGT